MTTEVPMMHMAASVAIIVFTACEVLRFLASTKSPHSGTQDNSSVSGRSKQSVVFFRRGSLVPCVSVMFVRVRMCVRARVCE